MSKLPSLPNTPQLSDVLAQFPGYTPALMGFVDVVMRGPGKWDIAERELFAAYVSSLNACTFCFGSHLIYAEAFGLDPGTLEAALDDPEQAQLAAPLCAVLTYLKLINAQPSRVMQSDIDAVLRAGVSEAALYEAVVISSLFNMMNRIVAGTGVTFDPLSDRSAHSTAQMTDPRSHRFVKQENRLD